MKPIRGTKREAEESGNVPLGLGKRRFVPGVTAGICRRPDDRPGAGTHPPNYSMNVLLVDSSGVPEEPWRLFLLFLYRPLPVPRRDFPRIIGR
jgi:hypothetical protein